MELTAPTMGAIKPDKFSLVDFEPSERDRVIACPNGHCPATVKKGKRSSIGFSVKDCESCPDLSRCPVKKGKKYYFMRFPDKEMRIARRRFFTRPSKGAKDEISLHWFNSLKSNFLSPVVYQRL